MRDEIAAMTDDELLAAWPTVRPPLARELPPSGDPPEWSGDQMRRELFIREELQQRGFTFADGEWVKADED